MTLKSQLIIAFIFSIVITSLGLGILYKLMWFDGYITILLTVFTVISSMIAMNIALLMIQPTVKKIENLSEKSKKVADGDYDIVKEEIKNPKEIKDLNTSFEFMVNEIKCQIEKIQEDEKEKMMMIENLAHDLKTPLSSIQSYTEGLKDGVISDEQSINEAYEILISQCNRMSKLFDEITQIMKVQEINEKNEPIQIDRLLIDILSNFNPVMQQEERQFNVLLNDKVGPFYQNKSAVERILINFIDNAFKFSSEDIDIEVYNEDEWVNIYIIDKGMGIDQAHIHKIFERTYRVEASRNQNTGGSGLGLYIAKTLARNINSEIEVQSECGSGTKICLKLRKYPL